MSANKIGFAGLLFAASGMAQAATVDYYLATTGKDSNPGTQAAPFATLEKARNSVRELKAKSGLPDGGVTVFVRGGEYVLEKTFTLTPQDSGDANKPVIYQACKGEEVSIVSKRGITGWMLLAEPWPAGLPAAAQGRVFVASVPAAWKFDYMYVNGATQPVAKSTQSKAWPRWPRLAAVGTPDPKGRPITFPAGVLSNLPGNRDVEISLTTAWWWNIITPIDDLNPAANTARLQSKCNVEYADFFRFSGGHFNLCNALPVLDQPGEWVVDSAAGKVYYWPPDGKMDGKTVFAPVLQELVRLQGDEEAQRWTNQVHHVEIRNLRFKYTDRTPEDQWDPAWLTRNAENPDAMIYLQGARDCVLDGNLIAYSGSQGIALDHYAQNVRITGNEIAYNSSGGVLITGYGPGEVDVNKNHLIERNFIHHVGQEYLHSNAVMIYGSNGITVQYNKFATLPYAGVQILGMPDDQMNDPKKIDTTDAYGSSRAIYQARWEELAKHRPFDLLSIRPFLHCDNNKVQYNIIDDYNTFVSGVAAAAPGLKSLGTTWMAIASVPSVSAIANTLTREADPSAPIYRLDGSLVAGGNADLWDDTIASGIAVTEAGKVFAGELPVWTGTNKDGASAGEYALGSGGWIFWGLPTAVDTKWVGALADPYASLGAASARSFYAISGILTVPPAGPPK